MTGSCVINAADSSYMYLVLYVSLFVLAACLSLWLEAAKNWGNTLILKSWIYILKYWLELEHDISYQHFGKI